MGCSLNPRTFPGSTARATADPRGAAGLLLAAQNANKGRNDYGECRCSSSRACSTTIAGPTSWFRWRGLQLSFPGRAGQDPDYRSGDSGGRQGRNGPATTTPDHSRQSFRYVLWHGTVVPELRHRGFHTVEPERPGSGAGRQGHRAGHQFRRHLRCIFRRS